MKTERDYWTIEAMKIRGGSFVQQLGKMAERADHINLRKAKDAWPLLWEEYEKIGIKIEDEMQEPCTCAADEEAHKKLKHLGQYNATRDINQ